MTAEPGQSFAIGRNQVEEFFELLPDYYRQFYPAWDLVAISPYRHMCGRGNGATAYLLFEKTS